MFHPLEMIRPTLPVRVEQWDHCSGFQIESSDPVLLDQVATPTGQTQIVQGCDAAQRFGNDMVNRQFSANQTLRRLTITTLVLATFHNCPAQSLGDVRAAHCRAVPHALYCATGDEDRDAEPKGRPRKNN